MNGYLPGYRLHIYANRVGQFDGSAALEALLASLPYIPQPERPKMKSLRGNPLPLRSWVIVASVAALIVIAIMKVAT